MALPPALHDLYQDDHPLVVIQKAAQVFISEYLINMGLWAADSRLGDRGNVLYVMPTQTQMDDFSQGRFERALDESPYLTQQLHPPPPGRSGPIRLRLKRLGDGYIYFRGADARRQLSSVDADLVLLDEFDLMSDGTLETARQRLASSRHGLLRVASTPRLPEAGVNALFLRSDQRYYFLECPGCGREQKLEWEANVDQRRMQLVCYREACRKPLDLWRPGHWQATKPGNEAVHGYHLSRLYSPLANIADLVAQSEDPGLAAVQEFHNSVLGQTYVAPGGGLTPHDLDQCRRDYGLDEYAGQACVVGVDVGRRLNVVIREADPYNEGGALATRLWFAGEVEDFDHLLALLMNRFQVEACVVDALPETHLARQFAAAAPWPVKLAMYTRHEPGHEVSRDGSGLLHANRLEALDEMFQRLRQGTSALPRSGRELGGRLKDGYGEYYRQLLAPQRTLERDHQGNWVARWLEHNRADHYAHAEVYAMLAQKFQPEPLVVR